MKAFTEPLLELAEFETIQKTKYRGKGMIQIAGSTGSQKSHLAYALSGDGRRILYILADEEKAKEVLEEYQFWMGKSCSIRRRTSSFIGRISEENIWSSSGWKYSAH